MNCNENEFGIWRRVRIERSFSLGQRQPVTSTTNRDVMLMSTHDNFRMPEISRPFFPPSSRRPHHAQITTSNNCPLQRSVPLDARFTSQYIEDAPKMSAILFFLVWLPRYNGIWPNIMFANKNKSISHSIGDAEVFFLREMKKAMNTRDKTMRGVRILMHENE